MLPNLTLHSQVSQCKSEQPDVSQKRSTKLNHYQRQNQTEKQKQQQESTLKFGLLSFRKYLKKTATKSIIFSQSDHLIIILTTIHQQLHFGQG